MLNLCLLSLILLPLFSTIQAGFLSDYLSKRTIHCVAIVSIATTFLCACFATWSLNQQPFNTIQITLYQWMSYRNDGFSIGVYFDYLTATMSIVVSFISCLVHLYSVGYMKGDVRYTRYFSLVSLFTLMMMILITANNFLQLFIGWEGVGLASYLLIGFWFDRDSAANASLKAFLVNRLGDFGLITGIALLVSYSGSLNFNDSISILPLIQTSEPFLFINMSVGLSLIHI